MKNLFHQTKQAFYFSLAFYLVTIVLILIKIPFALVLFSVSLLLSMIWVTLVLREIMLSMEVNNMERAFLMLFIILTNVLGGLVYFALLRGRVIGKEDTKK